MKNFLSRALSEVLSLLKNGICCLRQLEGSAAEQRNIWPCFILNAVVDPTDSSQKLMCVISALLAGDVPATPATFTPWSTRKSRRLEWRQKRSHSAPSLVLLLSQNALQAPRLCPLETDAAHVTTMTSRRYLQLGPLASTSIYRVRGTLDVDFLPLASQRYYYNFHCFVKAVFEVEGLIF